VCQRGMRRDRQAEEERICMRRLPKGATVGGRACQRCVPGKRCKGGAVPGVSQTAENRGRVRAKTSGRLCSSASRRRGERQRAGEDRRCRCSKERDWDHGISEQGDAKRCEREMHNRAAEKRCKMRSLPSLLSEHWDSFWPHSSTSVRFVSRISTTSETRNYHLFVDKAAFTQTESKRSGSVLKFSTETIRKRNRTPLHRASHPRTKKHSTATQHRTQHPKHHNPASSASSHSQFHQPYRSLPPRSTPEYSVLSISTGLVSGPLAGAARASLCCCVANTKLHTSRVALAPSTPGGFNPSLRRSSRRTWPSSSSCPCPSLAFCPCLPFSSCCGVRVG
jgi:hypothetical protein